MTPAEMRMKLKAQQARQMLKMKQAEMLNAPKAPDQVSDEMPEWLETSDRAVVKNLSNNNEEALKYLQGKYPDAEFKSAGDEIIARKRGEQAYGKLDPSSWSLKELGRDALDLGYDAAQMVAEGGGAALGTLANPGLGTALGAGAGAGAASTAKEALRKHFGLTGEMSGTDIATDAAMGAVLPSALKKLGQGTKWAAKKAAPSLYAKATGVPVERLKILADKGDELAGMSDDTALAMREDIGSALDEGFQKNLDNVSKMYGVADEGAGQVSMRDVVGSLDQEIAQLEDLVKRNPGTGAFQKKLDDAIAFREEVFSGNTSPLSMNIKDSMGLNDTLSKMTSWGDDAIGTGISETKERLAKLLQGKTKESILQAAPDRATADTVFKGLLDEQSYIKRYFGGSDKVQSAKKIQSSLKNLGTGKDPVLDGGFQRLPKETQEQIMKLKNELDTHQYLTGLNKNRVVTEGNLGSAALDNLVGKSPLEKLLTAMGTGAGYVAQGPVGGVVGAAIGKGTGKFIASPRSVKAVSKAGKKVGEKMSNLEELLRSNPELQNLLYGTTYGAAVE